MNSDIVNSREDYIKELKRVIVVMILGLLGLKFLDFINSNSTEIAWYNLVKSVMLISMFNITNRIMTEQYIKIRIASLFMIIPTLVIIYLLNKYCSITYEFAQGIFN